MGTRFSLQRLEHLSAKTLNGIPFVCIERWFGWLGVEDLTKIGLKARGHRGHAVRALLQAGQGAPAQPQPQARSPRNGRSK